MSPAPRQTQKTHPKQEAEEHWPLGASARSAGRGPMTTFKTTSEGRKVQSSPVGSPNNMCSFLTDELEKLLGAFYEFMSSAPMQTGCIGVYILRSLKDTGQL